MDEWFNSIYQQTYVKLLAIAQKALGDEALAEDVVQDVFEDLLKNEELVRGFDYPKSWLYKVLAHRIHNEFRRQRYRRHLAFEESLQVEAVDTFAQAFSEFLPCDLSAEDREILILFFEEQLSHKEIAQILCCSVPACRSRLARAKKRCKESLLEEER